MRWYEYADNPKAITELYQEVPSLQGIHVIEVLLSGRGPYLSMKTDLPRFPDKLPPRWKIQGYNSIHLQLDFWLLTSISLDGWTSENVVDIRIDSLEEKRVALHVTSPYCNLEVVAHHFRIIIHKAVFLDEKGQVQPDELV